MRRYLIISATAALAALTLIGAASYASASTTDVLTYGSAGGTNVAVGNVLTSSLSSGTDATFYTTPGGTTGGSCSAGSLSTSVTSNPAAGGTADSSTSSQTFGTCSDNLSYTINSIYLQSAYTAAISQYGVGVSTISAVMTGTIPLGVYGPETGNSGARSEVCPETSLMKPGIVPTCGTSVTCYYTGTNLSGTNVFTNQELVATDESNSLCPADMYFSATYNPLTDTSVTGDPQVYVNS